MILKEINSEAVNTDRDQLGCNFGIDGIITGTSLIISLRTSTSLMIVFSSGEDLTQPNLHRNSHDRLSVVCVLVGLDGMRNEFLYFLIIASVISLPYVLLNLFITSSSFPSAETNVHSKISQLQDEINLYLTQQRFLSIIQQNFTLILSNFQNKLSENEETFISFSNYSEQSSNLEQNRVDPQDVSVNLERFQQLKDEILKIRKYLTSSEKTIHDFEKQVLQLDQQTSNLELRSLKVIEEIISNSILEQLHAEVQNHCFSLSVSSHTLCPTLTKSEIVKIVSRLAILLQDKLKNSHSSVESLSSNDYFEFPSVEISQIISNLTSSTYRVAQTGILDSQILPSVGFSPNFIIGGPQEVISDNMALGHCWAMEVSNKNSSNPIRIPIRVHAGH
jgi:hypothetical protein